MLSRRLRLEYSVPLALFLVTTTVLFFSIFYSYNLGYVKIVGDYAAHYEIAAVLERGELTTPHFLYHVLVILLKKVLGLDNSEIISATLATFFRVLLGLVLFILIKLETLDKAPERLTLLFIVLLLLTAPIYLQVTKIIPPVFFGFINYLPYHNPTQNLMLVFVAPVSLIALRIIFPRPYKTLKRKILVAGLSILLVVLLSLSKPSYSIAILPALGFMVLYRLIRHLSVDWFLLIFGFGLPLMSVLGLQYGATYSGSQNASIEFGWLVVFREHWKIQETEVFAGLILSAAFPLLAYLLHFKTALKDRFLNFSWLVFGVSLVWSYFFYEGGDRIWHGNFIWSAYAALFVLMFSTGLFLLKHYIVEKAPISWRTDLSALVFVAHLISGLFVAFQIVSFRL